MTDASTSQFIASLIGPVLIAISCLIFFNRTAITAMLHQVRDNYAVVFLGGLMLLVTGLAIVRVHNDWTPGWPILITLFGWFAMLGGLVRMLIPDQSANLADHFTENSTSLHTIAAITLAFGLFLSAKGYGFF